MSTALTANARDVLTWRICPRAHQKLDGEGTRLYGGRWNSEGVAVVYSSSTLSLAALEFLVHVDIGDVPDDLVAMAIEGPDDAGVDVVALTDLPRDWNQVPDHPACVAMGDAWVSERVDLRLRVPSAGVLRYEGAALLHDIAGGLPGGKRDCTKRIRAFEAAWARLQSDSPGWPVEAVDREFHSRLLSWLKFHEAILIGELVPEALRFLRANPGSEELSSFDDVIVDEYQDLNRAEQTLLNLVGDTGATAIVGDADQSIYIFRHAHPDGISAYSVDYPDTVDASLVECRRCPKRVVAIADHLIRHNHPPETMVRLQPLEANPEGVVHVVQWPSLDEEAAGLAEYIHAILDSGGATAGEVLVLTPRRLLGYAIRDRLIARDVPAHSFYHEEALQAESAQRGIALLRLLVDPEDRIALRWWLSQGSPSGNAGEYAKLREHCVQSGDSPRRALERVVAGELRLARTSRIVASFRDLMEQLDGVDTADLEGCVNVLFPHGDEGCESLRDTASLGLQDTGSVEDHLEMLSTSVTQPELPGEGDFVRIMSLHKSKGLTSRIVVIAGAMQGLIPFYDRDEADAQQDLTLKEQRRLFYVAITRATEVVVISSATRIARDLAYKIGAAVHGRGAVAATVASQFLEELGPSAPPAKTGAAWRGSGWL